MTNRLAFRLRNALCSAFGVSLAACAGATPPATLTPVAVVDTVVVRAAADAELEQRVATLQLQLLERTAQVEDGQRQLEAARQEVVRPNGTIADFGQSCERGVNDGGGGDRRGGPDRC